MMNKFFVCRSFSICSVAFGKSLGKEGRIMNRFIGAASKKRSWYPAKDVSAASLPHIIQPKRGERNSRRMTVLNKLFMKYISDLMTTGELTSETNNLGIEISKVKIAPDFAVLKVYWVARGTNADVEVERVLASYTGKLRHDLTQLRVIGNVPSIVFVKDKSLNKTAEVDAILSKADFGDDFVPTDPSFALLSNLTLLTKLPKHLEEKILQEDGLSDMPVPSMQTDSLGIEHDIIMQKIKLAMKKAKAHHRTQISSHSSNAEEMHPEILNLEETNKGIETGVNVPNADLKKFFAKRLASQSKVRMNPKNYDPSTEVMLEENSVNDDEEDFDDIDVLTDAERMKEYKVYFDDFAELEENFKNSHNYDEKNKK